MRRHILAAVIACILGIVMLAALACYILVSQRQIGLVTLDPDDLFSTEAEGGREVLTEFIFQTEGPGETLPTETAGTESGSSAALSQAGRSSETEPDTRGPHALPAEETEKTAEVLSAGDEPMPEHRILFVGDSRTLGMRDALGRAGIACQDVFVGRVGEGVRWFREEGKAEMDRAIRDNPTLPVVLNFGVNDPQEINNYIVTYWDCIREHPDTDFRILSVNPIDEEFLIEDDLVPDSVFDQINNLNIARMNVRLKEEFGRRYLDSASFLRSDGFDTVDGLHFSTATYLKIHDFVVRSLFPETEAPDGGVSGAENSDAEHTGALVLDPDASAPEDRVPDAPGMESSETARERVG